MYARDVPPSRIARAKAEVGTLIAELSGARFGAVAFAGEPIAFPLTSDGAAIAQFFRQLSPNDMPVGGTAIARALEAGRRLLDRDPRSKKHARTILLVTDGEDLEGDPVSVAKSIANEGTTIHVVQIGGRTPEPIPEIDEGGEARGFRMDRSGKPLTTSLSAEGEEQLAAIASAGGGHIVRSRAGETGIAEIKRSLRRQMTEELSERVETVYADVYAYPAALALLLMLLEAFVAEAPRRRRRKGAGTLAGALIVLAAQVGCNTDRPANPFIRRAPEVERAVAAYDTGDAGLASRILIDYLASGPCEEGSIGTPDSVRTRPSASFDLGLAFFRVAERFGPTLTESGRLPPPNTPPRRSSEIDCALRIVDVVRDGRVAPMDLRSHAHYLAGNLRMLRGDYRAAVDAYDASLKLVPARPEDGDPIARRAAHNRAIALRLAEEAERPPPDAGADDPPPSDGGSPPDGGGGESEDPDGDDDDPKEGDEPSDPNDQAGDDPDETGPDDPSEPEPPKPSEPEPPQPSSSRDEQLLDQLEEAPTLQQEAARRQKTRGHVGMEDK
jgi:hypothetical protein